MTFPAGPPPSAAESSTGSRQLTEQGQQPEQEQRPEPAPRVQASQLRRLHPLSPLFRSWQMVVAAGALGFGVFPNEVDKLTWFWRALHGDARVSVLAKGLATLALLAAGCVLIAWLSWRVTGFALVEDGSPGGRLLYHRGLVNRQRSSVRLNRVQSVDVNQPLVPRLVGLAAVRLDMAAGADASVNLAYLTRRDAEDLRLEILRHTAVAHRNDAPAAGGASAPDGSLAARPDPGPDQLVARVSTTQLVKANLLDGVWMEAIVGLWVVAVVVGGGVFGWRAMLGSLASIIPVTIAIGVQLRRQVTSMLRDANFKLWRTASGIRVSSGLASTTNRTIDADRIQGVRVEEPYLWRRFGWARVSVDVAGADHKVTGAARLMPVADRRLALQLVEEVTGAALGQLTLIPLGPGARLLDPLGYAYGGVALLDHGAVSVWGRWRRTTSYVPYARVQSVSAHQGWLQGSRGVVTVCLDPPQGGQRWVGRHQEERAAVSLVDVLAERARSHRLSQDEARRLSRAENDPR